MRTLWLALPLIAAAGGPFATTAIAQVEPPPGWRWATDEPDSTWSFVQMAPGWHITTRPGALLYDPAMEATGRYSLESVQILFPGTSQSGYGLFLGGRELDGPEASYLTFLVRRDGHATVEARGGESTTTLLPWTAAPAIQRVTGDSTAHNVLRVTVEPDSLLFEVNAVRIAALPRDDLMVDGSFGFRTGPDLNLHVTTLDLTRRLAPVPRR
jgi:hypothetical protein